ncbi:C40 family peptidase [Wenyingzhuangia marina]|uniref:SH3 domain-containing protein n=1 Tax=Wenyingzhuangia marina TaxID=1195760 RepID=A0A1M5WZK3_9FLAO|nr:C40 family peptidase [Wenyingzhuangia marina]GGF82747.1 hydrolase Nlp/P60 [Wenyingzhuangia marina]SHH93106.1 SH3 domain-containing protein [Wenyingzhuangia marina]
MDYGICNLSVVPLRLEPSDTSEMVSQVLLGEHFKVLEIRNKWSKIRLAYDNYEGWVDNKQFLLISLEDYEKIDKIPISLSSEIINFGENEQQLLTNIVMGSHLPFYKEGQFLIGEEKFIFEGDVISDKQKKENIVTTALQFLNTPYLWGGKTPFGIDCSGLTQLVYKLNGYPLKRDAKDQATQGDVLSFIEESEPGDLAFFDNDEGNIIHVGIMMADNYIIHAHGKVRIDRIDHLGIYNVDTKRHTHKLRVIKKII